MKIAGVTSLGGGSIDSIKTVGATVLCGLWALEWAWHSAETNLRCVRSSGICMPNHNSLALIVSDTDRQTDMARSTRLVILIKNIYSLWGRKRFLLPVTYFPTNLVYPFTLRVTGINTLMKRLKSDPNLITNPERAVVEKSDKNKSLEFKNTKHAVVEKSDKNKSLGIKNPERAVVEKSDKNKGLEF